MQVEVLFNDFLQLEASALFQDAEKLQGDDLDAWDVDVAGVNPR